MSTVLDAREALSALLAPVTDADPDVQEAPVDAITTPALVIGWRTPMIDGRGHCTAMAQLFVMVVAGRLDIATGYEVIEEQYARVEQLLRKAGWAIDTDSGPGVTEIGNVVYLSCRIDVRCPITT